jgi:hypothetical protein
MPPHPGEAMLGLSFKRNADQALDRRRAFFHRRMGEGILATLPVAVGAYRPPTTGWKAPPAAAGDVIAQWQAFEKKWGTFADGQARPFPSNEEILERNMIGLERRGQVEDDWLPVLYSTLDAGESMVAGMFGRPMRFMHRRRGPAYSMAEPFLNDYDELASLNLEFDSPWARQFLSIPAYFTRHAAGRFGQHSFFPIDALNFAVELVGTVRAYEDLYVNPGPLRELMEFGLEFNIKVQETLLRAIPPYRDGSLVFMADWAPMPAGRRAIIVGVDAYVICSTQHYVEFGFEYNRRLIEHFGAAVIHFHCNRADLAAEVARLPNLLMFQFGGDSRDPVPEIDRLPEMRRAVGDIPMQINCPLDTFLQRLDNRTLMPNVWYLVQSAGPGLGMDEANQLAERVRAYRA